MGEFCQFDRSGYGVKCNRCGSWSCDKDPTCPPYITRSESDNDRLPHIKTQADNQAAYDVWWADRMEENRKNLAAAEIRQAKQQDLP